MSSYMLSRMLLIASSATTGFSYDDPGLLEALKLPHYMHWKHYLPDCWPRDPKHPSEFDLVCSQRQSSKGAIKVACVGDSITAVGHTSSKAHQYPSQLQTMLDSERGTGAYSVTNLGVGGTTLRKSGDSPYWNSAQFRALTSSTWDVVIIMLGTNDARDVAKEHWPVEHWPVECNSVSVDTLGNCEFARDYAALLDIVKGLGHNATQPDVFLMIPPPLMQQGAYNMNQTIINSVLPELIPQIAQANRKSVRGVIDVYKAMGGVPDWRNKFPPKCTLNNTWPTCQWYCDEQSCDQCHPNDVGCTHLAEVVKRGWLGPKGILI